jgi:hypothetical protein
MRKNFQGFKGSERYLHHIIPTCFNHYRVVVHDLSYFQNEEARMQRELEVQEKRIRKELVKQDILRQKVLIRFGLDLFFSSMIIFILLLILFFRT